jgi:hypothetical protein
MANDGQIVFEVTADGRHAISDIKDITRVIQQETGKWDDAAEQSANNIEGNFSGMLKKLAAGFSAAKIGKALLDLGKDAIQAASDLQEVQNVVDTTFGANGAAKIDAWAKKAGTQFGLTETQAKRFTSTLGAMMKSSGMAGEEIVTMSTDLAGLAADMASFYNLDFDTAFQKIRSGISGETEPLKQLGINMSVVNLEAFAMTQGIEKAFNEMSQGEQTMLRYQYLMQATADAQGDFSRTSDGYANGMRALESEMETLKTNLGNNILPAIQWAVQSINGLFGSDEEGGTWKKRRTVLDDVADIDAKTQEAIEKVNSTIKVVDELTKSLEAIGTKNETLEGATGNVTAAAQGVSNLAKELSKVKIEGDAKAAFESTLTILYNNVDALSKIKGTDADGVKDWLDGVAEEAKKLSPEDASAWATLMTSLVSEVPGLDGTEEGKTLIEQLAQYYLSLGSESEEAAAGLAKLGFGTDEVEDKQKDWLATCKELVRTMPGLADIINTQTGEVKGGIPAIREYADEWARAAKYEAQVEGIKEKKKLYEGLPEQSNLASDLRVKRATAKAQLMAYGQISSEDAEKVLAGAELMEGLAFGKESTGYEAGYKFSSRNYGSVDYERMINNPLDAAAMFYGGKVNNELEGTPGDISKAGKALSDYMAALYNYDEFVEVQPEMERAYQAALEETAEAFGMTTDAVESDANALAEAERNMTLVQRAAKGDAAAMDSVTSAVNNANDALKALADYAQTVHDSVMQSINNTVSGFERVDYQAYGDQLEKITELKKKQAKEKVGTDEWKKLQAEIDKANESLVNTNNIYKDLETQSKFLDDYLANMRKAKELGLSDELLAGLSDGSVESAEILDALVNDTTGKTAKEIDEKYQEIQEKKAALAQELAGQQLTVDQTYQSLAEKAKEAVAALDLGEEAKNNAAETIQGIADGIGEKQGDVANAVSGIISELERLNGYGINIDFGGFGNITFTTTAGKTEGSGRMGIPLVPHDDYIARLHEGERVLTAQENQIWNALRNGGVSGFDLETLGGVMRDNVKAGGNVYLDGRVVGSVISDQQGKSYRQLQRSGWQS